MIVIRDEQMAVLRRLPLTQFENALVRHFTDHYPRECREAGRESVLAWVRLGIDRAAERDLDTQRTVAAWLGVMMMLGSHFDVDPQFRWTAEKIANVTPESAWDEVQALHAAAVDYLAATGGAGNRTFVKAMLRAGRFDIASGPDGDEFEGAMVGALTDLHPEKVAFVGVQAVGELVASAVETAARHGLTAAPGRRLCAVLAFMLGSGFDEDPMYPWARRVLTDPTLADEGLRTERLRSAALTHLDNSLAEF